LIQPDTGEARKADHDRDLAGVDNRPGELTVGDPPLDLGGSTSAGGACAAMTRAVAPDAGLGR
jgi:hypothetical protein